VTPTGSITASGTGPQAGTTLAYVPAIPTGGATVAGQTTAAAAQQTVHAAGTMGAFTMHTNSTSGTRTWTWTLYLNGVANGSCSATGATGGANCTLTPIDGSWLVGQTVYMTVQQTAGTSQPTNFTWTAGTFSYGDPAIS
jgi:hypothetical protein